MWCGGLVNHLEKLRLAKIDLNSRKILMLNVLSSMFLLQNAQYLSLIWFWTWNSPKLHFLKSYAKKCYTVFKFCLKSTGLMALYNFSAKTRWRRHRSRWTLMVINVRDLERETIAKSNLYCNAHSINFRSLFFMFISAEHKEETSTSSFNFNWPKACKM